jgi:hypothetical protein
MPKTKLVIWLSSWVPDSMSQTHLSMSILVSNSLSLGCANVLKGTYTFLKLWSYACAAYRLRETLI